MTLGCTRRGSAAIGPSEVAADSVVGIVAVTGASFEQRLILRTDRGFARLWTNAADSAALSRLGGVEVVARGQANASGLSVVRFTVRRVDNQPVVDGILRRDGEQMLLETAAGRIPLGNPPAALREMAGARVWIGGPLDRGPNVYGIIMPAR
ncbi:MAG: hypothetical protein ABJF01_21340 [bacterium]